MKNKSRHYEIEELRDEDGEGFAWRARGFRDGQAVEETARGPLLALDLLLENLEGMDYYEKWGGRA